MNPDNELSNPLMQGLGSLVSMSSWFQQVSASSSVVCFASDLDASHLDDPIEFHFVVIIFLYEVSLPIALLFKQNNGNPKSV